MHRERLPATFCKLAFALLGSAAIFGTTQLKPRRRRQPARVAVADTKLVPSKEERGDVFTVRGRVSKPMASHRGGVRSCGTISTPKQAATRCQRSTGLARASSNVLSKVSNRRGDARPGQWKETSVVAEATGFGLEWVEWGEIEPSKPFTIRLVPDVPVHGARGRPAGTARRRGRLTVGGVDASKSGSLDAWLDAVKKGRHSLGRLAAARSKPSAAR